MFQYRADVVEGRSATTSALQRNLSKTFNKKNEVHMKKVALFSIALFIFAYGVTSAVAEKDSGCVRCHTNEALMKSLFIPPTIDGGEGEG
jgi:hypothetical protein